MEDSSRKTERDEPMQPVGLDHGEPVQAVDMVNNPRQYSPNGVDSFMHMKDQMGPEAFRGFLQGNVIKYTQRYRFKGKPVEDLTKAMFYLLHLAFEAASDDPTRDAELKLLNHVERTLHHAAGHYGINPGGKE